MLHYSVLSASQGHSSAQSPFAGTWKLDTATTKFPTGEPPKELTFVIVQ